MHHTDSGPNRDRDPVGACDRDRDLVPVGAYKKVANKVRPVPATLPEQFRIVRHTHPDPLEGLPVLPQSCQQTFI